MGDAAAERARKAGDEKDDEAQANLDKAVSDLALPFYLEQMVKRRFSTCGKTVSWESGPLLT